MGKLLVTRCQNISIDLAAELVKIADETHLSVWAIADYINESQNEDCRLYTLNYVENVVGFLISKAFPLGEKIDLEIYNIGVLPRFQSSGGGSLLLDHLINDIRSERLGQIALEVRRSNEKAIRFYARHGFETVGERSLYYKDPPDDALIMVRQFGN